MKYFKYFLQFISVIFLLLIFRLIGLKFSKKLSGSLFKMIGPIFRSNRVCNQNLDLAYPNLNDFEKKNILKNMWYNYGCIFAEYVFIKKFNKSENLIIENQHILENIKSNSERVIFVSGHFNNFELMAMHIVKSGIDLAAIYRPLNNIFLNPLMERIRKKYICKKQIKKGVSGTKDLLKLFKDGTSIALMIDQRVSQGIKCKFFEKKAFTTTIPAQFVKKFNSRIVPLYIERLKGDNFKLKVFEPIKFQENENLEEITLKLNKILEDMIKKNPDQWIWTHNRWK